MGTKKAEVTEFDKQLGMSISKIRTNEKNETQAAAAAAVGVNLQTYQHWEAGTRKIKAEHLLALSNHFGVSVDYLLDNAPARSTDPDVQIAMEYTGLSEEVVNFMHDLTTFPGFKAAKTMDNLNAFLSPDKFINVIVALNFYADEIFASRFELVVENIITDVLTEYAEYLDAENINKALLAIDINNTVFDLLANNESLDQHKRVAFGFHRQRSLTFFPHLESIEKDPAAIDRYGTVKALENALDNVVKHIDDTSNFPNDTMGLKDIIRDIYTHKMKCNELPKNVPTPDGLPF